MTSKTLYYVHDPMCSWCWAFTQSYEKFIRKLDGQIEVKRLLGGLAADSDEPMQDETQVMVKNAWHNIEKKLPAVKFNFDYWSLNTPRRSTYPACRAVIAARMQGSEFDIKMTKAIQVAYYQKAKNPSDLEVLLKLANSLGLNMDLFTKDINSTAVKVLLLEEIEQAQAIKANSFPSLVFKNNQSLWAIPIDYTDENTMLETIELILFDE